tara:strand:+ start:270 stop:1013 length:744 start_codon:yes stop_codon:yes gene_type:complete
MRGPQETEREDPGKLNPFTFQQDEQKQAEMERLQRLQNIIQPMLNEQPTDQPNVNEPHELYEPEEPKRDKYAINWGQDYRSMPEKLAELRMLQESPTSEGLKEMVGQMNMPSKEPLEMEGAGERAPVEFPQNLPMSQGPPRQQRRGMPGAGVSVKRPGFRGPPMPIGDDPMSDEGQIAVKERRNFNPLPQEKNINTPEGTLNVARRMFGAGPPTREDGMRRLFNEKRKTVLNEDIEGYPYNHPAEQR